jgi:hypothetical protein
MDKENFKEYVARLEEVGSVLEKLPSEVRGAAFHMLEPYITGESPQTPANDLQARPSQVGGASIEAAEIFTKFAHDKPADNVKLIAAYFYSEYGAEPITTDDIRTQAREVGITIPDRPDATLNVAVSGGRKLFNSTGRGKFKVTVHGEAYLKETYGVKKGTKIRQESSV